LNNGDGLVTGLYRSVWEKDPYAKSCGEVLLPDTIVIRHHKLNDWFFTDKQEQVKKKRKKNVTPKEIYKAFTSKKNKNAPRSDVVAMLISAVPKDKPTKRPKKRWPDGELSLLESTALETGFNWAEVSASLRLSPSRSYICLMLSEFIIRMHPVTLVCRVVVPSIPPRSIPAGLLCDGRQARIESGGEGVQG